MIYRKIDDRSVSVVPQNPDDLFALRRVVRAGDRVAGSTTRAIRKEREYARPDRGERVRIKISLEVEAASLDGMLGRLRLGGTIHESSSEQVKRGSHHSLSVHAGDAISITKDWGPGERKLLRGSGGQGFVLVAVDTSECGIARLHGTHLEMITTLRSGSPGKRYKTSFNIGGYLEAAAAAAGLAVRKGDSLIVFGPGETRKKLANLMQGRRLPEPAVVEGIDSAGEDGIRLFTRSDAMRDSMSGSRMARVMDIIDSVMLLASKKSAKFSMGYAETRAAAEAGAIESLVFSDGLISAAGEQQAVDFLNNAQATGAGIFGADSTTDAGLRVDGLGGVIATLRFKP
ncbi:RNA-binding protein [Cenarchaeum symbiosum A]|uniref:Protein pelota homolog n=1 Tax=Cenarchaeum symbiosum (strain A) TaxID=414004 RepID=PELO_CENSY|nr:RecName: Full=Protein pelota homolog [Cenarchaeum symbiosum A]ABK77648.1 RNA-binding protein [Cenarchaeum symbiosum A]